MSAFFDQYLALKAKAPGCLLLFRFGDFYELFGADAEAASPVLELYLTSREIGRGERTAMAGIPYHALNSYLPRLLAAGFRVAIAEQVSSMGLLADDDPAQPQPEAERRGLMERRIVRTVTAGTVTDSGLLDEKANRYLAALAPGDSRRGADSGAFGFAYADVSTGEFRACELRGPTALADAGRELERVGPAELLAPKPDGRAPVPELPIVPANCQVTLLDGWRFELDTAGDALVKSQGVMSLSSLGVDGQQLAAVAAGVLAQYVQETLRFGSAALSELLVYQPHGHVFLDRNAARTLELFEAGPERAYKGSLLWVLDQTATAMGARLLRQWLGQPLIDVPTIHLRQEHVAEQHADAILRARCAETLRGIGDLERTIARISQRQASARDLLGVARALRGTSELKQLGLQQGQASPLTSVLLARLHDCGEVRALIDAAIAPDPPAEFGTGVIRPGYSPELDALVSSTANSRDWVAGLEAAERERTGIRSLKVGHNRVFGYYIEITHSNQTLVPPDYERKQTLVNAERYVTPDLKRHEAVLSAAQERRAEMEMQLFLQVSQAVLDAREHLLATAGLLAQLDVYQSLAEVAQRQGYCRPHVDAGPELRIVSGRHPVVEVAHRDEAFVPNDTEMAIADAQIILLTGPNMAGKSTYLRQVAIITILAQLGSFVPAADATIGVVDRVFTRIGAQDDIGSGRSTFLVEMMETAALLSQSTPRSLLILDEVGRGTSTYDGLAIAQAVLEHIHNNPGTRARTLFATHFHELTDLAESLPRVRNYRMAVSEEGGKVTFLRRVVPGAADRSYGIHVARLAGLPRAVTRRAEDILRDHERRQRGGGKHRRGDDAWQLSLFVEPDSLAEELRSLDLLSMTPLEALGKLFALQEKAQGKGR